MVARFKKMVIYVMLYRNTCYMMETVLVLTPGQPIIIVLVEKEKWMGGMGCSRDIAKI